MKETLIPSNLESGVPPPVRNRNPYRVFYGFERMRPGDSMYPMSKGATGAFRNYAWRHKWKAATEQVTPGNFRCWRLE